MTSEVTPAAPAIKRIRRHETFIVALFCAPPAVGTKRSSRLQRGLSAAKPISSVTALMASLRWSNPTGGFIDGSPNPLPSYRSRRPVELVTPVAAQRCQLSHTRSIRPMGGGCSSLQCSRPHKAQVTYPAYPSTAAWPPTTTSIASSLSRVHVRGEPNRYSLLVPGVNLCSIQRKRYFPLTAEQLPLIHRQ